ncbi:hypothetical protein [Actinomadura algeriensis]|uniref:Uncharacterized protein n=1 Tax=Actinomadura algeriensis TaxID=1679523 RepID=A0ABR9JQI8_9ACTN|nr:hypothetical protein [Actinomadura algeriensis]MBE1532840.1 hypothetical protein [Actinomadura algeriensis]
MDLAELAKAVSRLKYPQDEGDLTCDEPGHPDGHTCLPVSADLDVDDVVEAFGERYRDPRTRTYGLPPLPFDDRIGWTHAWSRFARAIAVGRGPDVRPVVAVAERNMPAAGTGRLAAIVSTVIGSVRVP